MKLDELLAEYSAALSAAESQCGLPPFAQLRAKRRRPARVLWWAAAAAAAALWWVPAGPERPVARVHPAAARPELVRVQPASPVRAVEVLALRPSPKRGPAKALTARRPASRPEAVFVPLAENSMLPQPEFVQMVRVSVRPERLAELGVAWRGAAAPDGLVGAEVLLGDDGIARALRVLNEE